MSERQKNLVISALKEYASPVLVGLVGMMLWRDLSELRTDVKTLLAEGPSTNVRLTTVERDVEMLKRYHMAPAADNTQTASLMPPLFLPDLEQNYEDSPETYRVWMAAVQGLAGD
jgi:hypothetical protein